MEMTQADNLKEELITSNPEFRELAREHGRYETGRDYPEKEEAGTKGPDVFNHAQARAERENSALS